MTAMRDRHLAHAFGFQISAALVAWAALAGCGNDSSPSGADDAKPVPVPGCEAIDHAPCDVRAMSCQVRLGALAACLRGDQATDLPAAQVISEADFAAMLA